MLFRILAVGILLSSWAAADVKARTRVTASGATVEATTLVKGSRVRQEPAAAGEEPQLVRIYQCDLGRLVLLNPRNQAYRVIPLQYSSEGSGPSAPSRPTRSSRSATVVTLSTTVTDTGLQREVDGRPARGVNTDTSADSPEGSCSAARKIKLNSRGWYADMPGIDASCADPNLAGLRLRPAEPECSDRVAFRLKGSLPPGLPLLIESTLGTSDGEVTIKQEMVGITAVDGLDAALFEAPAGYRLVQTQEELLASDDMPAGREPSAGVTRPERATRSGEARPEPTRVCVAPLKGVERAHEREAHLRLATFLNRQGLQPVTLAEGDNPRSCHYNVAVEKAPTGTPRYFYRVTGAGKAGSSKAGSVNVNPAETEDQLWERLAQAIARDIAKKK